MNPLLPYSGPLRQLIPNGRRRAPWHDYRSRCIYMITINGAQDAPPFSILKGTLTDHNWPPTVELTSVGKVIASNLSILKNKFPFIKILRRVIMPEHLHFAIFITEADKEHLGNIILSFKSQCTRVIGHTIFESGYHDKILLKKGQLKKILNYISDNPRRRMERQSSPGFFHKMVYKNSDGQIYHAYGNSDLLNDPDIEAVRISRRFSEEELRGRKIGWIRTVENCGILCSPFISPNEKKVLKWASENGGRIIYILPNGFSPRFSPKGFLHQLCAEGRLLLIAPPTYSFSAQKLTRRQCEEMNALAEEIALRGLIRSS